MAGAGLKAFTSAVLTSSDVNTYLMQQSVMVFASVSARTLAFTNAGITPTDGMISWRTDDDVLEIYENANWRVISGSKNATYPNQIALTINGVTRPLPYAISAAVTANITGNASVTFPVNRFANAPAVVATVASTATSRTSCTVGNASTSGVNIYVWTGAVAATVVTQVYVVAISMTASAYVAGTFQ